MSRTLLHIAQVPKGQGGSSRNSHIHIYCIKRGECFTHNKLIIELTQIRIFNEAAFEEVFKMLRRLLVLAAVTISTSSAVNVNGVIHGGDRHDSTNNIIWQQKSIKQEQPLFFTVKWGPS